MVRLKPDTTTARTTTARTPAVRSVRLQADETKQAEPIDPREAAIVDHLAKNGASFFGPLHEAAGGGYPAETVNALWSLTWQGLITNDTFQALRAFTQSRAPSRRRQRRPVEQAFRSRRSAPPSAEGRWVLIGDPERVALRTEAGRPDAKAGRPESTVGRPESKVGRPFQGRQDQTAWAHAWAQQLLARHGVLTREAVASEGTTGGFGVVYPVLKAMEEAGRIRRGYFVAGLGATQFALTGALDLLRSLRDIPPDDQDVEVVMLSATDPANPYGAAIKWPQSTRNPTRSVGATVILVDGALAAYLARGDRQLLTFLPDAEPQRSKFAKAIARALRERSRIPVGEDQAPRGMLIEEIDGVPPSAHALAPYLARTGFQTGALGFSGH